MELSEKFEIKIFACPECKCRKFTSINGLNVHMTKAHTLHYKIILRDNKAYKLRKNERAKATILIRSNLVRNNHSKLGHK